MQNRCQHVELCVNMVSAMCVWEGERVWVCDCVCVSVSVCVRVCVYMSICFWTYLHRSIIILTVSVIQQLLHFFAAAYALLDKSDNGNSGVFELCVARLSTEKFT